VYTANFLKNPTFFANHIFKNQKKGGEYMNKIIASAVTAVVALGIFATASFAATSYSLFGDATLVSGGNPGRAAQLESNEPGGYAGVDLNSSLVSTLSDLQNLATDYKFTENSCGGGSPRFQVNLDNGAGDTGNIFVYLGPPPGYTGCPMNVWTPTGNLVTPASLVDTSQLDGGMFYDPYSAALVKYGSYSVTGIQLVADGEWVFTGDQVVLVDNIQINTDVVTFEPNVPTKKEQCKKGGYQNLEDANGQPFKNQGQCVSYFNHN